MKIRKSENSFKKKGSSQYAAELANIGHIFKRERKAGMRKQYSWLINNWNKKHDFCPIVSWNNVSMIMIDECMKRKKGFQHNKINYLLILTMNILSVT